MLLSERAGQNPEGIHGVAREKELGLQTEVLGHFLLPTIWGIWGKSPNLAESVSSSFKNGNMVFQSDWEKLKVTI